jgi:putative nucleotidyltransferase with HDIG domain
MAPAPRPTPAEADPLRAGLDRIRLALGEDAGLVLVGGAVRDLLLDREGGDWDLASALLPEEAMARARAAGIRVIPTGLQHGTVTLMVAATGFELTTFRGEGPYLDGRRPESVHLGVSLTEDLARRDFTINAIALPAEFVASPDWRSRLVDPFGGRADLETGLIRAVGAPLERFSEDGLRGLRACRFAAQLSFSIEPATLAAIPHCLQVSEKVAVERVLVELSKLLCGATPALGLQALADTGLLALWLPELLPMIGCEQNNHHCYPVWEHTLEVIRRTAAEPDLRWAALLHDVGKPATWNQDSRGDIHFHGHEAGSITLTRAILERLRASHALTRKVLALVAHHGTHPGAGWSDGACRRFLKQLRDDELSLERWGVFRLADQSGKGFGTRRCLADHRAIMARLQALEAARPPLAIRELALDGKALMALAGRKGGPWLGQLQTFLLEAVLDDPAVNAAAALEQAARLWLETHPAAPPPS